VIVAFVLPKRGVAAKNAIGVMGGEALERAKPVPCGHGGSNEKMDVVGHHDEGMEMVSLEAALTVVEGLDY